MKGYKIDDNGLWIAVRLQPKSSKTELGPYIKGQWQLKVQAPPVEGAANKAAVECLSKLFKCPKTRIHLERGGKSREKLFRLETYAPERLSYLTL